MGFHMRLALLIAALYAVANAHPTIPTLSSSTPSCSEAGQPDSLCDRKCTSPCRGFKPGFNAADCVNTTDCSDTPPWAVGSVCLCSSSTKNCTSDSDCPGSYCMIDPAKKPPYFCHKDYPPAPPTPPTPAGVPNCTAAGKEALCQMACESTCRDFPPGFKAAGCALQKYCTNPPAWAKGSVCLCSGPSPPTPPTPPSPPPVSVPDCRKLAGKAVLCQMACESTCRDFPPGFKAAGCALQKYCTNPPAWAKGSVCKC